MLKDKLKALRLNADLTQSELAKEVELPQSCISLWEKGSREPNLIGIKKLAEFFNVTTDYLLDLTNEQKNETEKVKSIGLTEEEKKLLEMYQQLSPDRKKDIFTLMKTFAQIENTDYKRSTKAKGEKS